MRLAAILSARTECDVRAVIVLSASVRLAVLERAPVRRCPYHIASHLPEPVSVGNVALAPFGGAAESAAAWPAPQLLRVQSDAQVNDKRTKGDNQSPVNRRRPGGLGVLRKNFSTASRTPSALRGWRRRSYRGAAAHRPCALATDRWYSRWAHRQPPLARDRPCVRPPGTRRPPSAGSSGHAVIRVKRSGSGMRSRYARDRCRG